MAKIYYRLYKKRIDENEITLEEAIELAKTEVPARWRNAVVELLEADKETIV